VNNWLADNPLRRAVTDASRGPTKLSATIRCFSSNVQRRRAPVETTSSRETFEIGVWSVIRLCLHPPSHCARRPSPERYDLTGCYAEKVKRRASEVLSLAKGIGFAEAATFGVSYPTAHYALFARGGAQGGETVFIHGASGSVGTSAVQLAKRAGLRVVGSAGTSKGLELVRGEGADHAVNHTATGYMNEVLRFTGGKGPELILEMLANVNLAADMDLAAKYGRIVVIGNRGEITVNPRVAMMKELDIRGVALWNATAAQMKPIMRDILAGAEDGSLRPVVGREMRLSEAAAAHIAVLEHGIGGKIVLIPS